MTTTTTKTLKRGDWFINWMGEIGRVEKRGPKRMTVRKYDMISGELHKRGRQHETEHEERKFIRIEESQVELMTIVLGDHYLERSRGGEVWGCCLDEGFWESLVEKVTPVLMSGTKVTSVDSPGAN